ncbi:MAG: diguanylate cyclase domain-containing protein [Myxococcota bacterium]
MGGVRRIHGRASYTDLPHVIRCTAVERYTGPSFTASFGVASAAGPEASLPEMIRRADQAMYEAKRQGRDRVITTSDVERPAPGEPGKPALRPLGKSA